MPSYLSRVTMAVALIAAYGGASTESRAQNQNPFLSILTGLKDAITPSEAPKGMQNQTLAPGHGVQDVACEKGAVDPFELTDNVGEVIKESVSAAAPDLIASFARLLGGGKADLSSASGSALKAAKASARTMNWLPMRLERQLGVKMHEEQAELIDRDSKVSRNRNAYRTADAMLQQILSAVHEPHPYTFQLFVTKGQDANAQAIPGGYLYINYGALPAEKGNAKERQAKERSARFMLAHEIAHVLKRHQTREVQGRIFDTVDTLDKAMKFFNAKGEPDVQVVLASAAYVKRLHESYSPDQEKQADACAIRVLASFDALEARHAFASFMDVLPPDPVEQNSTYPKKADRQRHGNAVLMSLGMR